MPPLKYPPIKPGDTFGDLVVREIVWKEHQYHRTRAALCDCTCGASTVVVVPNLRAGRTKSCGHTKRGPRPGVRNNRVFSLEEADEIRAAYDTGTCTQQELAEMYGSPLSTIQNVLRRRGRYKLQQDRR